MIFKWCNFPLVLLTTFKTNNTIKALHRKYFATSSHNFPETSLEEIRQKCVKLEGGKITLTKNHETGIAFICIDHIEKKNGISGKMMVDLNEIISKLEEWESGKGIILHSNGDAFCSGGYLETVKKLSTSFDGYQMATLMHDSVLRFRRLPLVSVAVVNGKAIGGGAELILVPDFRLLTPSAEVAFVEARMGVGTGWGGGTLLTKLVGHQKALDLLLTSRKVSAEEALRIGLADNIIEDGDNTLDLAVEWLNARIRRHVPSIVHTVKNIVNCCNLSEEKKIFAKSWMDEPHIKALNTNIKHK